MPALRFKSSVKLRCISYHLRAHLHFPGKLVGSGGAHEKIGDGQIVVDGGDHEGVADPEASGCEDCDLLVRGDLVSRLRQVANVGERDHPFESRSPEEDYHKQQRSYLNPS